MIKLRYHTTNQKKGTSTTLMELFWGKAYLLTMRLFSVFLPLLSIILLSSLVVEGATRNSTQSGDWNNTATWGGLSVPVPGDNVTINSGHIVTYSGDLNWNAGSIGGNGHFITDGNLTISSNGSISSWDNLDISTTGDFNYQKGGFTIGGGKVFNIDGDFSINGDMTINGGAVYIGNDLLLPTSNLTFYNNGILEVGGDVNKANSISISSGSMDARGDIFAVSLVVHNTSILATGGTLSLDGNATVTGNGILDIDGSLIADNITMENQSLITVEGDLDISENMNAKGTSNLVVAGDYNVSGTTYIQTENGSNTYVFGNISCTNGDCNDIENLINWLSTTPGLPYLSSVTAEFDDSGTFTVPSGISTIVVECWGGGGGGGNASHSGQRTSRGGGGAGGSYAAKTITSASGTYSYVVGAGGTGGNSGNASWVWYNFYSICPRWGSRKFGQQKQRDRWSRINS
jgi:hypothetical protein